MDRVGKAKARVPFPAIDAARLMGRQAALPQLYADFCSAA
jgi:hypothetical protein